MKRIVSLLVCIVLICGIFPVAYSEDRLSDALSYTLGSTVSGKIDEIKDTYIYTFTLPTAGSISISCTGEIRYVEFYLYGNTGNRIWDKSKNSNGVGYMSYTNTLQLCKGKYYFEVRGSNQGSFNLKITHTATYESFPEEQGGTNNIISSATPISCNTKYIGHTGINDNVDIYTFALPQSGKIHYNMVARGNISIDFYDETGKSLCYDGFTADQITNQANGSKDVNLCKGQYYFSINCGAEYDFELIYTPSNETFSEKQNGSNNTLNEATPININQKYIGHLALNDSVDIYRITVPNSPIIVFPLNSGHGRFSLYDATGVLKRQDSYYTTPEKNVIYNTELPAGTYYIAIVSAYPKNYTFYFTDGSVPAEPPAPNAEISVLLNSKKIEFDQLPVLEYGRTLVPLRAIFEALGASVQWDGATQTVTAVKGDTTVSLQIGSTSMYVNGVVKTLDVPAKLINSRTLVPVRAISEAFGCAVGWDGNTQTVIING